MGGGAVGVLTVHWPPRSVSPSVAPSIRQFPRCPNNKVLPQLEFETKAVDSFPLEFIL